MKHDSTRNEPAGQIAGQIRVGIGGWSYEPWRETFYPNALPKKQELAYASRKLTAIEINSTFYRLQSPNVFAKWHDETPDDFRFSIKAPRHIVQRRVLRNAGESLDRFLKSGLEQLGAKLGPILWQLPPERAFDAEDLDGFLRQLPASLGSCPLRHALEVRHESFRCLEFIELVRRYRIAIVYTHAHEYPAIGDVTSDFVYARLRQATADEPTGYPLEILVKWADRARCWAAGGFPGDLPSLTTQTRSACARDVFIYFINGAKERAPAAAMRLLETLRANPVS